MPETFPIIEVPQTAPEELEEMGTKEKFWFRDQERGLCLYKKARQDTGEDWSEKVAAELCELLGLPHADYELATFDNWQGVISPSFLPEGGSLIPGNEILAQLMPDYPGEASNPSQHTISNVFQIIEDSSVNLPSGWTPPDGVRTAADLFVGYLLLLLDAWIGNTDRHHENWAFIRIGQQNYLAQTYDHASSLGRNETDEKRQARLTTKDSGFSVQAYVEKCRSCLYAGVKDTKPLKTFDAFCQAAQIYPQAARIWLDRLAMVPAPNTLELFNRLPSERISSTALEFAQRILEINQQRLLRLQ
ncbi:MAG: HipA-like protein [Acaryochloridaceae cyanobacterium CSU_3_4]|nr:HipA-like protein [Acaryochloridaceae cyanobacterium CSU_3_4]